MLTPKAQYSLADAKRYFKEHLSAGDYYAEGQHVPGQWFGQGAEILAGTIQLKVNFYEIFTGLGLQRAHGMAVGQGQ